MMKKIIFAITLIVIGLISINFTNADSTSSNNFKIYKSAVLTRHQIIKDYSDGKLLNKRIEKYFISLYFKSDRKTRLKNLKTKFETIIKKYEGKSLSTKTKKELNVVKNLYFRTLIELK